MADSFATLRTLVGSPRPPRMTTFKSEDELRPMQVTDGLKLIPEYASSAELAEAAPPQVSAEMKKAAHLWVVREEDAVHAPEYCKFGAGLAEGRIKHTNLTGGAPAYSGGELIWLGEREVLVNGCSGRYGPTNAAEMAAAAQAFANAGHRCWSTGYDEGSGYCFRFGASVPFEVQAK